MNRIVILSGLSGGGKTQASNLLEDMGYRCIDQYPPELLEDFIKLIQENNEKYPNIVLTIPLIELDKYKKLIDNSEINSIIILLTATKDAIINRYKFSRRIHPLLILNLADSLTEAIDEEIKIFDRYSKKNVVIIDTTNLSLKQHKQKLDKALNNQSKNNISITFESFGYKKGLPKDADIIIDVRFLDNPYYVSKLKNKTGNDKAVKDYVMESKATKMFIKKIVSYLDFSFKAYSKDERRHITVCIGCTGGQHRSVVITNYLFDLYKKKYLCYLNHREID